MLSGLISHTEGFLTDPDLIPLCPLETVQDWGRTLIVAPHPDDESLGCGGAIALLRHFSLPVSVLFISDGTGSHPNSLKYPQAVLRDLRESEAREALRRLGVLPAEITFLRLPDGSVPGEQTAGFPDAAASVRAFLSSCQPQTILLPWRRDPHPDHRAASQIVQAALGRRTDAPRLLEYPIWAWERAASEDAPYPTEARPFRLELGKASVAKQSAIAAHVSQITHLIDDDPHGFWLSPEVLAHFERPWEVYLEVLSW